MGLVFFLLCLGCQLYQSLKPQIAASWLAANNPTHTTVTLQKPFCMFDSSLHPNKSYAVYLYAMEESASAISSLVINSSKPLDSTFQQTRGGQLGPYKAALFNVPNCASPPRLADVGDINKLSDVLKQYLFRVGDDGNCLYDPNFLGICNPPLAPDTTYRFKYLLLDTTEGIVKDQTLWSDAIKTRRGKSLVCSAFLNSCAALGHWRRGSREEGETGHLTQTDQRGYSIPQHVMSRM
uniref:Uroplakin 3A n=1 Tax=Amazona collaria TaxID=241587 RepID=A0A8B9F7A5_9PSIT